MLRFILAFVCGVFLPTSCLAQTDTVGASPSPRQASFCNLKHNPTNYDGQWITVRGRVSMEFEDFSLDDPDCNASDLPGIWLTFGGDQDEITVYCCVNPIRKKGVDIEAGGQRVPLVRDAALREFQRVLQSARLRRPDGHPCEGNECYFYRPLTATITGLFLAGQGSGQSSLPGYGHLGCCHLLVIRQVSDISAERTPVPAGRFKCSKETWNAGPSIAAEISNLLACASSQGEACDRDQGEAFERIAAHWNDQIAANSGHHREYGKPNGESVGSWISSDLMISYSTVAKENSTPAKLAVTRQVCVPVSTDLRTNLASAEISCQEYAMSWRDDNASAQLVDGLLDKGQFDAADAKIVEASKAILQDGDQSWRLGPAQNAAWHALQLQTRQWRIVPDPALQLDRCQDAATDEQKSRIMGCDWYSSDGMLVLSVALRKYPKATKANPVGRGIPWVVTDVSATICRTEPQHAAERR